MCVYNSDFHSLRCTSNMANCDQGLAVTARARYSAPETRQKQLLQPIISAAPQNNFIITFVWHSTPTPTKSNLLSIHKTSFQKILLPVIRLLSNLSFTPFLNPVKLCYRLCFPKNCYDTLLLTISLLIGNSDKPAIQDEHQEYFCSTSNARTAFLGYFFSQRLH